MKYEDCTLVSVEGSENRKIVVRTTNLLCAFSPCPSCGLYQCWNLPTMHRPDCEFNRITQEAGK